MPRLTDIEGRVLAGTGGVPLGTVEHVLFHPAAARVVALMVRPDPLLVVVERKAAFVALELVRFGGEAGPSLEAEGLPSLREATEAIGHDPETTVIWRRMPVASPTGDAVGTVADVEFDAEGVVRRMHISAGMAGDVAHGWLAVDGEAVRGFDGQSVVITAEASELPSSGGLARRTAAAVASAKRGAAETAEAAGSAVTDASYIAGRAIGSVARSGPGKKARGALRGLVDAYREGRDGTDDTPDPRQKRGA